MPNAQSSLHINAILPDIPAASRKQVYQLVARQVHQDTSFDANHIFDELMDRERQAPSGIGGGVAVPQIRYGERDKPYILLGRMPNYVDFHAVDQVPVDLLCLLISPIADGPLHLRRLARLSRIFRDKQLCNELRDAESADAMHFAIINREDHAKAA